jgi:hypothetical protein
LTVAASMPVPQLGNIAVAAAAARTCLHDLNVSLADTGIYAGLVQVAGMAGGSESAEYLAQQWDPAILPKPLDPPTLPRPPGPCTRNATDSRPRSACDLQV